MVKAFEEVNSLRHMASHAATLLAPGRLEEFGDLLGLCFGAWGEASEGVHQLVQTLAESIYVYIFSSGAISDARLPKIGRTDVPH